MKSIAHSPAGFVPIPIRRGTLAGGVIALFLLGLAMSASVGAYAPPDSSFTNVGCAVGNYSCFASAIGGQPYPYYVNPNTVYGYQYTDYRYCDDGQVIVTAQGLACANGTPFHVSGTLPPPATDTGSSPPPPDATGDPRTSSFSEVK
jgi:hypothetical protein